MVALLADEDFKRQIVFGIRLRDPSIDIQTIQELGLAGSSDDFVVEWAAKHNRVIVSHDCSTMTDSAITRMQQGLAFRGLIIVHQDFPIGRAIDDLAFIAVGSDPDDWRDAIEFLTE